MMSSMGRFTKLCVSGRVVNVFIKHTRLIEDDILRHACAAIRIVIMNDDNNIRRNKCSCV